MSRSGKNRIDTSGGGSLGQNPFENLESAAFPLQPGPGGEISNEKIQKSEKWKNRGRVEIRREKAGRGGKTVTTAGGFSGVSGVEKEEWLRELRRLVGSGGTLRAGTIEIQGDRRNELMKFFAGKGFRPVLAGG